MEEDEEMMREALRLAARGEGRVAPNPLVGCVIRARRRTIGRGWHEEWGGAHAEVNAVRSVSAEDRRLLREATVYVNLEPCAHQGKTPPCAPMLVREGVRRVVVSNLDPYPEVSGRGLRMLEEAGIEVRTGVLEKEGRELNRRFFTLHTLGRPYVILKWAQSADGLIAGLGADGRPLRTEISNAATRRLSHHLRATEMAIVVGRVTVETDDPSLTVRDYRPEDEGERGAARNPMRVVIDPMGSLDGRWKIFRCGESDSVTVFVDKCAKNATFAKESPGARVEVVGIDFGGRVPESVLRELGARGVSSVIVEGGRRTLQSFLDAGLWDECRIETNPSLMLGEGVAAPVREEGRLREEKTVGGHRVEIWERRK